MWHNALHSPPIERRFAPFQSTAVSTLKEFAERTVMKKQTIIFSGINLVGLGLISLLILGMANQARTEQRDFYDFGDSFLFLLVAGPILIVCVLVNLYWGFQALVDFFKRRDHQALVAFSVVAVAWVSAYVIDRMIARL